MVFEWLGLGNQVGSTTEKALTITYSAPLIPSDCAAGFLIERDTDLTF